MRYIDADVTYEVLTDYYHHRLEEQHRALKDALNRVPIVDAEPIIHGKWFSQEYLDGCYCTECSECGAWFDPDVEKKGWKYCPKCGAKMDGEIDG